MEWCLTKDDNVVTVTVNLLLTFSCWSLVSESNKRIGLQENASNMCRATSLRADGLPVTVFLPGQFMGTVIGGVSGCFSFRGFSEFSLP